MSSRPCVHSASAYTPDARDNAPADHRTAPRAKACQQPQTRRCAEGVAMSTDLENITASFGLVRREFKDVHAVVSRLDTQVRRLAEPRARPRPGGAARRVSPDRPQGKAAARGRLPAAFRR